MQKSFKWVDGNNQIPTTVISPKSSSSGASKILDKLESLNTKLDNILTTLEKISTTNNYLDYSDNHEMRESQQDEDYL